MENLLQSLLNRSVNKMGPVNPIVKESALEVVRRAYDEGICMQIVSGFRTKEQQDALYRQGRTAPGYIMTNVKGGQSYHNYGLAVDYALVSPGGREVSWTVNREWLRVAEIAKSIGFTWGGDRPKFKDYGHLEMNGGLSIAELQKGKLPSLISIHTKES
ncbi:M15 family metallopeptidase [Peribacillus sp. SCS-155]|uniref:M15 family metallopeptidase n=1 Tax=Peribacillus sedimenti TaxID=3115297 RepID=UPI00390585A5